MAVPSKTEIELVQLRKENKQLRSEVDSYGTSVSDAERPKTWHRLLLETVVGGSVLSALIGGGFIIAPVLLEDEDPRCAPAHAAMQDDELNVLLSPIQRDAYIDRQFEIAMDCGRKNT